MKKSSLTTAVVAGIAGVAGLVSVSNAMNINPDGLGQVLIYPYYTVNGGNVTLISVVNTTDQVKAVKVRFLEGRNSQEVLDFNLYLSPFDVWTGSIAGPSESADGLGIAEDPADAIAAGPAVLTTTDKSCTVPGIPEGGVPFVNYQYALNNPDDGVPSDLSRTREGHIEMIEMGEVVNDGSFTPKTWATHPSSGTPRCDLLQAAWDVGGAWGGSAGDRGRAVNTPLGGLFGGAEIVDVPNGTNISYNADAIEGFYVDLDGVMDADLHYNPENILPNFSDGRSANNGDAFAAVSDAGTIVAFDFDAVDYLTPGLHAVSALFMHNEIYNEYVTSAGFASEWVVTFPTKGLHLINGASIAGWGNDEREPFISSYRIIDTDPGSNEELLALGACEYIGLSYWDREERTPVGGGTNFSPRPPGASGPALCWEAQVITFSQTNIGDVYTGGTQSSVLGSYFARNIAVNYTEGWAQLVLGTSNCGATQVNRMVDSNDAELFGLPVTGFWASKVTLGTGSNVLSNFSVTHKHRADRDYSL